MSQTTNRPAGKSRKAVRTTATVTAVRHLTPHMIRVTIGGQALAAVDPTPMTDRYIKLVMAESPEPEGRPVLRTYTIRRASGSSWDIDVVTHGDVGYGGPWAQRVRPGDEVSFVGPGGDYAPSPDAPWHLMAGDESALPAIAAACEALPDGAVAHVFVEVADAAEEQEIASAADLHLTWVHRSSGASPTRSCTARRVACASCAAGPAPPSGCRVSCCRRRATGAADGTTSTGAPRRPSGGQRWSRTTWCSARTDVPRRGRCAGAQSASSTANQRLAVAPS
jgi:NADPH-dependent ferric siderophore reductase